MKKLFVLFLLVALVPFTVGCSLWGHDEDKDVLDVSKVTLTAKLPASVVAAGSLRAAVPVTAANPITLTIGTYVFTGTMTGPVDGFYTVTFISGNLTPLERATLTDTTADNAVIKVGTAEVYTFSLTLASTSSVVITIFENGTVSTVTAASTTPVTTTAATGTVVLEKAMNITAVSIKAGNALTASATTAELVANLTPTFAVTFDNEIATLTGVAWKVDVTHVTAAGVVVKSYSLDSTVTADKNLFKIDPVVGNAKQAEIQVIGTTAPKNLEPGNIYKVKLTAANLKSTAGGLVTVTAKEYFFKTPQ